MTRLLAPGFQDTFDLVGRGAAAARTARRGGGQGRGCACSNPDPTRPFCFAPLPSAAANPSRAAPNLSAPQVQSLKKAGLGSLELFCQGLKARGGGRGGAGRADGAGRAAPPLSPSLPAAARNPSCTAARRWARPRAAAPAPPPLFFKTKEERRDTPPPAKPLPTHHPPPSHPPHPAPPPRPRAATWRARCPTPAPTLTWSAWSWGRGSGRSTRARQSSGSCCGRWCARCRWASRAGRACSSPSCSGGRAGVGGKGGACRQGANRRRSTGLPPPRLAHTAAPQMLHAAPLTRLLTRAPVLPRPPPAHHSPPQVCPPAVLQAHAHGQQGAHLRAPGAGGGGARQRRRHRPAEHGGGQHRGGEGCGGAGPTRARRAGARPPCLAPLVGARSVGLRGLRLPASRSGVALGRRSKNLSSSSRQSHLIPPHPQPPATPNLPPPQPQPPPGRRVRGRRPAGHCLCAAHGGVAVHQPPPARGGGAAQRRHARRAAGAGGGRGWSARLRSRWRPPGALPRMHWDRLGHAVLGSRRNLIMPPICGIVVGLRTASSRPAEPRARAPPIALPPLGSARTRCTG